MAYLSFDICVGPLGYSASSHGGHEWKIVTEAPTLVFVMSYYLELGFVAHLHCDFFILVRVHCPPCTWLYGLPVTPFAALLSWSVIGESLSLLCVTVKFLHRRVLEFSFPACMLVTVRIHACWLLRSHCSGLPTPLLLVWNAPESRRLHPRREWGFGSS